MPRVSPTAALTVLATVAAVAGCGAQARQAKPLRGWLSYDSARRAATITVLPGYDNAYGGFNFNGYAKGQVEVVVPVGWKVTVRCVNTGLGGRHSCAIVAGAEATRPAFPGASSPDPSGGVAHGRSASFSFTAAGPGVYRIASLVPDQERAGMWDVLEITRARLPTVVLLRRAP